MDNSSLGNKKKNRFRFDRLQPKHIDLLTLCFLTKTFATPRKVSRRRGIRLDAQNASKHNTLIVRTIFFEKFVKMQKKYAFRTQKGVLGHTFSIKTQWRNSKLDVPS